MFSYIEPLEKRKQHDLVSNDDELDETGQGETSQSSEAADHFCELEGEVDKKCGMLNVPSPEGQASLDE